MTAFSGFLSALKKTFIIRISWCAGLLIILVYTQSCTEYPDPVEVPTTKISLFPGPEDMVEVRTDSAHYLLVSCASRRDIYAPYGEIIRYDPGSGEVTEMPRKNEPEHLFFKPHGIDLALIDHQYHLYVILHDDGKDYHPVVRYKVYDDSLVFDRLFHDPLLESPNALAVLEDGSFFVCNDAGNRNSTFERILRLKKGNILYFDIAGNTWNEISSELAYPAGLLYHNHKIYVSATLENTVYSLLWDGKMARLKEPVMQVSAPDNISRHGDRLIVTSHLSPFRFIRHASDSSNHSPSGIYAYSLTQGKQELLFWDDGEEINAASIALFIGNELYIGQIFEPYLLRADIQ